MEAPELVYLPGGTFLMGDERGSDNEKPVHRVRLPAFALGRTPVTWGDYRRFCEATDSHWPEWLEKGSQYNLETGTNDYYAKRGIGREALDLPVVGVAWADALAYCEWLRGLTGKPYRLPTEAEWEYACRAGTQTRWSFGDDESKLGDHAWYGANVEGRLHPVAQKRTNPWGLYDMHGNCWEWCSDWYASDYYRRLSEAPARVDTLFRCKSDLPPIHKFVLSLAWVTDGLGASHSDPLDIRCEGSLERSVGSDVADAVWTKRACRERPWGQAGDKALRPFSVGRGRWRRLVPRLPPLMHPLPTLCRGENSGGCGRLRRNSKQVFQVINQRASPWVCA